MPLPIPECDIIQAPPAQVRHNDAAFLACNRCFFAGNSLGFCSSFFQQGLREVIVRQNLITFFGHEFDTNKTRGDTSHAGQENSP